MKLDKLITCTKDTHHFLEASASVDLDF